MGWKCQCICPCPLPILPSSVFHPSTFLFAFPSGAVEGRKCTAALNSPFLDLSCHISCLFLAMIGSFIILSGRLATYLYPSFSVYFIGLFSILSLMAVFYFSVALQLRGQSESLTKHWWETEDFPTNSFCRSRICTADHDNMRTHTPAGYTACRLFHLMTHLRVTTSPPPCLHAGAPFSLTDNLWSKRPDFSLRSTGSCSTSS